MILANNTNIQDTPIWNEVKNWDKEDKISLITLLSRSLAETSGKETSGEKKLHTHEKYVELLNKKVTETLTYKKALIRMKALSGKGGRPVPADENGLDALIEAKYQL